MQVDDKRDLGYSFAEYHLRRRGEFRNYAKRAPMKSKRARAKAEDCLVEIMASLDDWPLLLTPLFVKPFVDDGAGVVPPTAMLDRSLAPPGCVRVPFVVVEAPLPAPEPELEPLAPPAGATELLTPEERPAEPLTTGGALPPETTPPAQI